VGVSRPGGQPKDLVVRWLAIDAETSLRRI